MQHTCSLKTYRVSRAGKAPGVPQEAGSVPVRLLSYTDKYCNFRNDPLNPQLGGRVPAGVCRVLRDSIGVLGETDTKT